MTTLIKNKNLIKKEKRALIYTLLLTIFIIIILTVDLLFGNRFQESPLIYTLNFIRFFNSILAILAVCSCLISYNRLKNDTIFLITLMYSALAADILLAKIDYLAFYYSEFTLANYISLSSSLLRIFLLILAVSKENKLRRFITSNKKKFIEFITLYYIISGLIEKKFISTAFFKSIEYFYLYNGFLTLVYIFLAYRLTRKAFKESEYLFLVFSSSLSVLAFKAIYAIFATIRMPFHFQMTSVSITYIASLIIICGLFIEVYIYISKTEVLNYNLKTFYDLVENNKHTSTLIYAKDGELLYSNKKINKDYTGKVDASLNEVQKAIDSISFYSKRNDEILNSLYKHGVWKGLLKNHTSNKSIDCSAQLIDGDNISISFTDISDEISAELELEKFKVYDKARNELFCNISHELRTPVNIFYSTLQLLDMYSIRDNEKFKEMYEKFKNPLYLNCKRMLKLINNIMDMSKIDSGKLKPTFKNYDIVSIIEDVTLSVVNYATLKSINVQFDTDVEENIVKCDSSMIERIMLNLLSNAIKFSKKNTNIYVNISTTINWIEISIKDEGIGISDNTQHLIFEKFVQADKSFNRKNEGSGVGLSIVKSLIDLHNGHILVDSKLNEGSTFTIYLPNISLKSGDFTVYNVNDQVTELEFSDIYEVINNKL